MAKSRYPRYWILMVIGFGFGLGAGVYYSSDILTYLKGSFSLSSWAQSPTPEVSPTVDPTATPSPIPVATPPPAQDPGVDPALLQAEVDALRAEIGQLLTRLVVLESQLQTLSRAPVTETNTVAEISRPAEAPPTPAATGGPEIPIAETPTPATPAPATPTTGVDPTLSDPDPEPVPGITPLETPTPVPTPTPAPTPTSTPINVGTQTISLPGDVLFDFDKALIRPEAEALLDGVVERVRELPGARVIVEGHTDNIGDDNYNKGLSQRRAEAVKAYLERQLSGNQNQWATQGYGSSRPVADNSDAAGRQRNRRVDITIAP